MKIHEVTMKDGTLAPVSLETSEGELSISDERGRSAVIPEHALDVVMQRYGLPLDAHETVRDVDQLVLPSRRLLRHVRHLGKFDVIAKDYLVLDEKCALASTISGVLLMLAKRNESSA